MDNKDVDTIHSWWLSYLQGLAGISTFGASLTFAILTTVADPSSSRFDKATIQTFIAVAFLLFLIVIGICNFLYFLIYFAKEDYFKVNKFTRNLKCLGIDFPFNQWLHCANLLVTSTLLFAFLMLALVIIGYAEVVGTLAVPSRSYKVLITLCVTTMTPRKDSIPHETRTAAEPRQNKLYTVRIARVEQVNPSVRLLRLALPQEPPSDESAFDAQSQETFSFLPGQWLDVHIPSIPQAGGFTITSTPADAQPLPIPDPTIIQDGTENLSHQQGEFGTESAAAASDGRYPYVELAVQQSPSNPAAAWLWRPHKEILGSELRVRVGGSFVWPPPPTSVRMELIRRIVFVAGGVGINPLISILSHLTEEQTPNPAIPLPERSPNHPLHIRFLYSTQIPAPSIPDEKTLEQILFLSRLRNIVQRTRTVTKRPANIKLDLDLFLTNLSSPVAATQATEILNKVTDGSNVSNDSPLIRVHGQRINKDDLGANSQQEDTVYYICGRPPMTDAFVQYLEPVVGKERVLYEKWW
ncbi:hypothetical protein ZTR_06733 [Talaromyces verruculosus]|nr:hypothetical protein ZTR_06733 [Talaromyces verruculosus]